MSRLVVSLILLLILPVLAHAEVSPSSLQIMRYSAFSACSHLLLHYNPNQSNVDPGTADRYRRDLQQLQTLLGLVDDPQLKQLGERLLGEVAALENTPADEIQLRPVRINPILETQAALDRLIHERYSALQNDEIILSIDLLSLDVQRLLLYYQIRTFGSLAVVYLDELKAGSPEKIDSSVISGFQRIELERPEAADLIAKLRKKYEFVRPHLIQQDLIAVPSSTVYYLSKVSDGLAKLSEQEASTSHAH